MSELARVNNPFFRSISSIRVSALAIDPRQVFGGVSPVRVRLSDCRSGSHPLNGSGGCGAILPRRPAGFFAFSDLIPGAHHV